MKLENNYYAIAYNDLKYAEAGMTTGYYNNVASGCQQVVEKFLKFILENYCIKNGDIEIMRSHKLKTLAKGVMNEIDGVNINLDDMSYLTDYYYDARYPGVDYTIVTEEEATRCIEIARTILEITNSIIKRLEKEKQ
ncbi:HEPN domain-containing protein [Anaeromicropila herbilytica]|uniref:HEPN domain-containing protein n=1 Tax=Anaeromicropila herbilytica TaxID=2785025 RepID=A0A7R7IBI7_9FIRM|nr:HEPN domain-containing protein [Anaeromicropila herbilytica]BCN28806.1 hypothetical protein bsdtb5_01010 [Anaeromicropila herbilytica]